MKQSMERTRLVRTNDPLLRCDSIVCMAAIEKSQGTSEEFSTGSHPQYPPHPSVSYAQKPPRMMPVPRIIEPNTSHGVAGLIQLT